jgi:hypothetical protein
LLGAAIAGCGGNSPSPGKPAKKPGSLTVTKQPVNFSARTFDPANPPQDMPPMTAGEAAQCDSDFRALVTIGGQPRRIDATHGTLTVAQIKVNLFLIINIWTPNEAPARIVEHEEGHRQISEFYYQTAEKVAERIAADYEGRLMSIEGGDLDAAGNKALQEMAAEITEEYKKQINPAPAQLLYDNITDHSRNDVVVKDAVDHAIKNAMIEYQQPAKAN